MGRIVRDDILIIIALDELCLEKLHAEGYFFDRGENLEDLLASFSTKEEYFSATLFHEASKNAPKSWIKSNASPDKLFEEVVKLLAAANWADVASKNEDLRLVRVAFRNILTGQEVLKQKFINAYRQLIRSECVRRAAEAIDIELDDSLAAADRTGYFKDLIVEGVNPGLDYRHLQIWFLDEPRPREWSASYTPERSMEGPSWR